MPFSIKRSIAENGYKKDPAGKMIYDSVVYVTGVEYPDDYIWQKDTAYGMVACSLIVTANGKRILELPIGDKYYLSPDPDMHRMVGGHLYSDYSSDSETIICKDGVEIFRYDGREMICGFMVRDNTVYTLGRRRSGTGLTLRRNGETVFCCEDGIPVGDIYDSAYPTGALYEDNGELCFSYSIKYTNNIKDWRDWYVWRNGKTQLISLHPDIDKVFDIRVYKGDICIAANMPSATSPLVLFVGDKRHILSDGGVWGVQNCKIVPGDNSLMVKGETLYNRGESVQCTLWVVGGFRTILDEYARVYDFFVDGQDWGYVMSRHGDIVDVICLNGKKTPYHGFSHLMSLQCARIYEGKMYVAITPYKSGEMPTLWVDGAETTIPINGYLTGVYITKDD